MTPTFQIHAPLRRTKVLPRATLDTLRIPLRPQSSELTPLPAARDLLPASRVVHRLTLTYAVTLLEGGKVTPVLPTLKGRVYDGALEGHIYGVFDANKSLLSFGDVYPKAVQARRLVLRCCAIRAHACLSYRLSRHQPLHALPFPRAHLSLSAQVPKGEYTIRVALRHDCADVLERLRDLPLRLDRAVDAPITVPVHSTLAAATIGGSAASERYLRLSERCVASRASHLHTLPLPPRPLTPPSRVLTPPVTATLHLRRDKLWVGPCPEDKLPKDAKPGCSLAGSLKLAKGSATCGERDAPGACELLFVVPPAKAAAKEDEADASDARSSADKMREGMRDAQVRRCAPCPAVAFRLAPPPSNPPFPLHLNSSATCRYLPTLDPRRFTDQAAEGAQGGG